MVRALAIGATTRGCARSHASATAATVVPWRGGDLVERLEHRRPAGVEVRAGGLGTGGLDVLAARPVLAGEEALRQAVVRQHGEVPRLGDRQERALEVALDQVVVRLQHGELGEPVLALELEGRGQPLGRVVRRAEVAHRAGAHERVERAQRLLERRVLVVEVGVVEVDAVGPEALERGPRLALDVVGAQVADRAAAAADLRGEDDRVARAALGHPAPDDRLRAAVLDEIGVRGVDEVAARRQVGVEDREGLRLVRGPAEHVGAEAQREDVEVGASEGGHGPHASEAAGASAARGAAGRRGELKVRVSLPINDPR